MDYLAVLTNELFDVFWAMRHNPISNPTHIVNISILLGLGMVAIPTSGAAAAGDSDGYTDEDTDGDGVVDADRIAADTHRDPEKGLSKADEQKAHEGFVNVTMKGLQKGDTVSLIGFGSFSTSKRSARTGRNPQTGKEIQNATKNVVKFKAGAELSKRVN
ncbi:HU family DNA-binding protein [Halorubrum trueperi]|uniref:HU family DNA-binding protein n=1 Tax=Halorubrum trueperi TaxID=2004704 RepID=A0ABD5UT58_9EURY